MKELNQKEIKYISGGNCLCYCMDQSKLSNPPVIGGQVNDPGECIFLCRSMGSQHEMLYCQQ